MPDIFFKTIVMLGTWGALMFGIVAAGCGAVAGLAGLELSKRSDLSLVRAQALAAAANQSAALAIRDVSLAQQKIADANRQSAQASLNAAIANRQTAQVRKDNLVLEENLRNQQYGENQFEKTFHKRRISLIQRKLLTESLKIRPSFEITLQSIADDDEAAGYKSQLIAAFTAAGEVVIDGGLVLRDNKDPTFKGNYGMRVSGPDAPIILQAFDAAGIAFADKVKISNNNIIIVDLLPPVDPASTNP